MKIWDAIWTRLIKVGAFLMGMLIMYHETFADKAERPYLYVAAISLMGLQVADTLDKMITAIGVAWSARSGYKRNQQKEESEETNQKAS